jgi:hypothetical protein
MVPDPESTQYAYWASAAIALGSFWPVAREIAPLLDPELLPELDPLLDPELLPELDPLLDPELLPELDPLLDPELLPELDPLLDPELLPELDPLLDPELLPELAPLLDPQLLDVASAPVASRPSSASPPAPLLEAGPQFAARADSAIAGRTIGISLLMGERDCIARARLCPEHDLAPSLSLSRASRRDLWCRMNTPGRRSVRKLCISQRLVREGGGRVVPLLSRGPLQRTGRRSSQHACLGAKHAGGNWGRRLVTYPTARRDQKKGGANQRVKISTR